VKRLHKLNFDELLAYYVSVNTTAAEILDVLEFEEGYDVEMEQWELEWDQVANDRTRQLLTNWLQTSSPDMLMNFLQCTTGQMGLTNGMKVQVHSE
jgi:hypothetical protein